MKTEVYGSGVSVTYSPIPGAVRKAKLQARKPVGDVSVTPSIFLYSLWFVIDFI